MKSNLINALMVFLGSGLGGVCRYLLSKCIQSHFDNTVTFPWGTFVINITGCFLIGLIYGIFDRYGGNVVLSPRMLLLLTTGFCGGFTTFSTFINENYMLFQSSNLLQVLIYAAGSLIAGFILLYAGFAIIGYAR